MILFGGPLTNWQNNAWVPERVMKERAFCLQQTSWKAFWNYSLDVIYKDNPYVTDKYITCEDREGHLQCNWYICTFTCIVFGHKGHSCVHLGGYCIILFIWCSLPPTVHITDVFTYFSALHYCSGLRYDILLSWQQDYSHVRMRAGVCGGLEQLD